MASLIWCSRWSVIGILLTVAAKAFGNSESGLPDILRRGDNPDSLFQTLQTLQRPGSHIAQPGDQVVIRPDQLKTHISQYSGEGTNIQKPSVGFMVDVFEHLLQGEDMSRALGYTNSLSKNRLRGSDTIRSFTATRLGRDYAFHIPVLPNHEKVEMAELRFLGNQKTNRRQRLTVRVQKDRSTFIKHKVYFSSGRQTQSLTVGSTSIINHFKGNVTIKVSPRKSDLKNADENEDVLPILVIYSRDEGFLRSALKSLNSNTIENLVDNSDQNAASRRKRAANSNNSNRKKGRKRRKDRWRVNSSEPEICKMHNFKVDFDLIGWGPWIIHPKTYNARVCFGQCPSPITSEYSPTNHVMLQSLMRLKRPLSGPEPCCVPTKLRPLSMLYFEYDDIVVRHHQEMIVDECGCR